MAVLTQACLDRRPPARGTGPAPAAAQTFDAIAHAILTYSDAAPDSFVVSNPERPSDVLCGLWLARRSGLFEPGSATADASGKRSRLELVPLFEKRAPLRYSTRTMAALYGNAAYKRQLAARASSQRVTLGDADDGVRERLARQADAWGVDLRLRAEPAQARGRFFSVS